MDPSDNMTVPVLGRLERGHHNISSPDLVMHSLKVMNCLISNVAYIVLLKLS